MKLTTLLISIFLLTSIGAIAQTGSADINFTIDGKPLKLHITHAKYAFNDTHGYWNINPHNGDRHFNLQPDAGYGSSDAAFIYFNGQQPDFDLYYSNKGDTTDISFSNSTYAFALPLTGTNSKPLHLHINSFTASEISFTISGSMRYHLVNDNSDHWGATTVSGQGHFYRDPAYDKSDVMTGCNCDPFIYAKVYDQENNIRTPSACENGFKNKMFNLAQQVLKPLYTQVAYKGKGKMAPGEIEITNIPEHTDILTSTDPKDECSMDYRHFGLVSLNSHKSIYSSSDQYGLRLSQMPTDAQAGETPQAVDAAGQMRQIMKDLSDKKITPDEANKKIATLNKTPAIKQSGDDFKKNNMELQLNAELNINPSVTGSIYIPPNTPTQHNIKGSFMEILLPEKKDGDGNWTANKLLVLFGKFSSTKVPSGGMMIKPVYPAKPNKLTLYNMIVTLKGGKDLIPKASAAINFDAINHAITKQ